MSRTALALDLDENGAVSWLLSIPRLERLQKLQTVRLRVNGDLYSRAVLRRRLEGVLASIIATGWEFET